MTAKPICAWLDESTAEEYIFNRLSGDKKALVDNHLRSCPACRKRMELVSNQVYELKLALALHEVMASRERRASPRQPASGRIQLSLRVGSRRLLAGAELRDRSENGLGVLVPYPCRVGDRVEVRRGQDVWHAIVRYCRRQDSVYSVGLQIIAA